MFIQVSDHITICLQNIKELPGVQPLEWSFVVFKLFITLLTPGPRPRRFCCVSLLAEILAAECWDMFTESSSHVYIASTLQKKILPLSKTNTTIRILLNYYSLPEWSQETV